MKNTKKSFSHILKLFTSTKREGLTGLSLPQFCACPKPGLKFSMSYVVVFFVFSELR
jgi:hypothetical protein